MALSYFLSFTPTIEDEATDAGHIKWINLMSMAWGVSQPHSHKVGQLTSASAQWEDMSFEKIVSMSSPGLMKACAAADNFKSAKIEVCRTSKNKTEPVMVYELKNVFITGAHLTGAVSVDEVPIESYSMTAAEVVFTYNKFKSDGSKEGSKSNSFNLELGSGK